MDIVNFLLSRLSFYNSTQVPINFPDVDPLSYPKYHDGFWKPWLGWNFSVLILQINLLFWNFESNRSDLPYLFKLKKNSCIYFLHLNFSGDSCSSRYPYARYTQCMLNMISFLNQLRPGSHGWKTVKKAISGKLVK